MQKNRAGVSAEVFGDYNKKGAFIPKVVPKTKEQEQRINIRLGQAFMFSNLDP